jgi:hypothetical protein
MSWNRPPYPLPYILGKGGIKDIVLTGTTTPMHLLGLEWGVMQQGPETFPAEAGYVFMISGGRQDFLCPISDSMVPPVAFKKIK